MADLQTVKKTIRSLLISVKEGLTVREIENDFIEFEGMKLPFDKFGFQNARAFLESLTDVVYFFRDENGVEKMKQVSDASTVHIEKLVARQKSDPKRKKSKPPLTKQSLQSFSNRGKRGGHQRGGKQSYRGGPHQQPLDNSRSDKPSIKPLLSIPAHEPRNTRRPLLTAPRFNRGGARPTFSTSNGAFANDFHQSMMNDPISKKNMIYAADLERSSFSTVQNNLGTNGSSGLGQGSRGRQHRNGRGTRMQTPTRTGSATVQDPYDKYFSGQSHSPPQRDQSSESDWYKYCDKPGDKVEEELEAEKPPSAEDECVINKGVQNKVKQVLAKVPKGLWANRLPVMYKQMFHQELPMKDYGHHSVIEFVMAMPHLVRVERPYEKGDWLLSDASVPREEPDEPLNRQQQLMSQMAQRKNKGSVRAPLDSSRVPYQSMVNFKESVRQVLQHHTDGVMLQHFPKIYEEMTGYKLDPQALGYDDMNGLLLFFTEEEILTLNYDSKDSTRLLGVRNSVIRCFDLLKEAYKPHPNHGMTSSQQNVPSDVVGRGRCYPPADMDNMVKGGHVEVHVSSVISPNYFWVQKRSDMGKLDDLMDELEEEYSKNATKYRMPLSVMVHGQVCATLFEDNNWHRGIITGSSEGKVKIYYVDYGNRNSVDPATICFLQEKFLSLPVQAIQSKLAFLLPREGEKDFSENAKHELFKMVLQRPLFAMISDIENLVLSLVLVDTTGQEDVFINDQMVSRGLARFMSDEQLRRNADTGIPGQASLQRSRQTAQVKKDHSEGGRQYVKLLKFCPDIGFHVIYMGGELFVLSSHISCLFWEEDCLAYRLQQEKVVLHKVVLTPKQNPAICDELIRRGAFTADDDLTLLNLYRLESVPMLLDLFGDHSQRAEDLKAFIKNYLDTFDHNDPYWKGQGGEGSAASRNMGSAEDLDPDMDPDDVLTKEELQLALHSMQINRKRILKRMTSSPECTSDGVRELESTEDAIIQIQALLFTLNENKTTDLKLPGSGGGGKAQPPPSDSAQTEAPQPKNISSTLSVSQSGSQEPRGVVKTNVVTPMVKPTHAAAAPQSAGGASAGRAPSLAVPDLLPESLELMAANQQLVEEIRQKDQIISSMLGGGGSSLALSSAPLSWMTPSAGLQPFPPPQVNSLNPLPLNPAGDHSLAHLGHNPSAFVPNPSGSQGSRSPQLFSFSGQPPAQSPLVRTATPRMSGPLQLHHPSQPQPATPAPGQEGAPSRQTPAHADPSLARRVETASTGQQVSQEQKAGVGQSAAGSKPELFSLPMVGVVRPRSAVQPAVYPPYSVSQPPTPLPQPPPQSFMTPLPAPAPPVWPRSAANTTALQQQFLQLQQRQMALCQQQQAMLRPRLTTAVLTATHALPPSSLPPGVGTAPACSSEEGSGGGGLLPGMMPLLQSFQESCSVRGSAPPPPGSSCVPVSQ